MSNTYPPYKVGNIPTPSKGFVQVPLANTIRHIPVNTVYTKYEQGHTKIKSDIPKYAGFCFYWAGNIFGYLVIIFIAIYKWLPGL